MTSAAAFVEVFIPVVRDHGGNSAPQCARTCAPRLQRLVRIGIVRLGVLHYLLTESEEETHTRTPRRNSEKKPNADSQGPVMRMLDRFVVVGIH